METSCENYIHHLLKLHGYNLFTCKTSPTTKSTDNANATALVAATDA